MVKDRDKSQEITSRIEADRIETLDYPSTGIVRSDSAKVSHRRAKPALFLPIAVGACVLAVTVFLWRALVTQQTAQIERKTELEAASVKIELSDRMQERILALVRMAKRWERQQKPPEEHWRAEAALYRQDFGGYQAIEWVDSSFHVRWIEPIAGNKEALNLNLAFEERRRQALEAARDQREIAMTHPIKLVQGGKGFLVYVPLFPEGKFDGFILGVFNAETLFDTILHENITQGYSISIFYEKELIYQRNLLDAAKSKDKLLGLDELRSQIYSQWTKQEEINLYGVTWCIKVLPAASLLAVEKSPLPEVILGAGSAMAILLALAVGLAQKSARISKEKTKLIESISATNQELEKEMAARELVSQELLQSEERFRAIALAIPLPLVISRKSDGTILYGNRQLGETFGLEIEKLIGRPTPDFYYDRADRQTLLEQLAKTGFIYNYQVRAKKADGTAFWVMVSIQPLVFKGEEAIAGVFYDITSRVQAEEELSNSQQQYEALVRDIDGILWQAELPTLRFSFISQTVERLLGYPVSDWLEKQDFWQNCIHPDDRDKTLSKCLEAAIDMEDCELEYRAIAADGSYVWFRNLVSVVIEAAQPRQLRGIAVDISKQKQAELALRENQTRLNLLNCIATSIAAGMSVEQVISSSLKQVSEYFPSLRVSYSTIDDRGYRKVLDSLEPPEMPFFKGMGFELSATPQIWQALHKGLPTIICDILEDSQIAPLSDILVAAGTRALLEIPLQDLEGLAGLLCFHAPAPRQWNQYEISLLQDVGDYLSVAIKEARAQRERFEVKSELLNQSNALASFTSNLKQLHRLATTKYDNLADLLADYLQAGCEIFQMPTGMISQIEGNTYTIQAVQSDLDLQAGQQLILGKYYCSEVLKEQKTVAYKRVGQIKEMRNEAIYKNFKIESYIGTPILASNSIYGTLNFCSIRPRAKEFETYERELIELMAQSIGKFIEADRIELERKKALEDLRDRQRFIQQMAEALPNILYIDDLLERRNIYANREIAQIIGYSPEEIQNMNSDLFKDILHPEDITLIPERLEQFDRALDGDIIESEYRVKHKNGSWRWLYSREIVFARTEDGDPKQILGTATDITDRKRVESELHSANEKLTLSVAELKQYNREITLLGEMSNFLQSCLTVEEAYQAISSLAQPLFPSTCGGIFLINEATNLVEAVTTWGEGETWGPGEGGTFGAGEQGAGSRGEGVSPLPPSPFPSASPLGETLFAPHECWALRRGRAHWVDSSQAGLRCSHLHGIPSSAKSLCLPMMAQGETLGLLVLLAPENVTLTEAKQHLAVAVAEHISLALANLKLRETMQNQSIRDPLTGLFNRRYLDESLERELHRASSTEQTLGIVAIDIDRFMLFNDKFGHIAGDTLLKALGASLQKNIRSCDIACRYGGQKFILILPESNPSDIRDIANKIRLAVKDLRIEDRGEILDPISISLGLAYFPEHGLTGKALIEASELALQEAKAQGRYRIVTAETISN